MAVEVPPSRITRALISAAGRQTALDTSTLPKALIDIEGATLISHVLRQLYAGGIVHVVLIVAYHGAATIAEVERVCKMFPVLCVEVVDLGSDYAGFYAKSILAARSHCTMHEDAPGFLIATADHIFDETLVADMCRAPLVAQQTEVCVLVDFARAPFVGLPETAVGVRCDEGMRVAELSRRVGRPMVKGAPCGRGRGIEAGLFACTHAIFDQLDVLDSSHEYFTLTEAVDKLASSGLVSSLATAGRKWIAVETVQELQGSRSSGLLPCPSPHSRSSSPSPSGSPPAELREPLPVFFVGGDSHLIRRKAGA